MYEIETIVNYQHSTYLYKYGIPYTHITLITFMILKFYMIILCIYELDIIYKLYIILNNYY